MDHAALIEQLRQALATHAGDDVACAYLFGSTARGEARAGSDVDLAVLYEPAPPRTLMGGSELAVRLEKELRRTVDLVILNRAPPDLVHRILRDGQLLLERDAPARIRFEVRSRNEYFDVLPYLNEYRRAGREATK